jgi:hypothetical protein
MRSAVDDREPNSRRGRRMLLSQLGLSTRTEAAVTAQQTLVAG